MQQQPLPWGWSVNASILLQLHRCLHSSQSLPAWCQQPGQVLHVPKHWWHTVQTVSCHALSINTWIDAPGDDSDRLREALVRLLVSSLLVASGRAHPDAGQGNEAGEGDSSEAAVTTSEGLEDDAPACGWVNPTEQLWSAADNLDALRVALAACVRTGT